MVWFLPADDLLEMISTCGVVSHAEMMDATLLPVVF